MLKMYKKFDTHESIIFHAICYRKGYLKTAGDRSALYMVYNSIRNT